MKALTTSRSFQREIPVLRRFFERRFQPLSVGGFFSNQRESSWCSKSPFPSKTQNRQIARTSPLTKIWKTQGFTAHVPQTFDRKTQVNRTLDRQCRPLLDEAHKAQQIGQGKKQQIFLSCRKKKFIHNVNFFLFSRYWQEPWNPYGRKREMSAEAIKTKHSALSQLPRKFKECNLSRQHGLYVRTTNGWWRPSAQSQDVCVCAKHTTFETKASRTVPNAPGHSSATE